jgi:lipopolysaccharide export LptBFGC system permease protein LptF
MPIIWQYITKTYLKIFFLSLSTLFGLSFLIKHKKLTLLFCSGVNESEIIQLIISMLAISLPHMLTISSLTASFVTAFKLSASSEITTLRAQGLSLIKIFTPIYYLAFYLMLLDFFCVSELIPFSKINLVKIEQNSADINPLLLIRKNELPALSDIYAEMSMNSNASNSKNVILAKLLESDERISLWIADSLQFKNSTLKGINGSLITHIKSEHSGFDHLVIDNQNKFESPDSFFSKLQNKNAKIRRTDTLSLFELYKSPTSHTMAEFSDRISKILSLFSLTILGLSCGLITTKSMYKKSYAFLFFGIMIYFSSHFLLKNHNITELKALILSIAAHMIIVILSVYRQIKLSRGAL